MVQIVDPLTGAVVGAIVLFFLREVVAVLIVWIGMVLGIGLGGAFDAPWLAGFIIFFAWVAAVVWQVFAIVWIIIDIITIIQIAAGSA